MAINAPQLSNGVEPPDQAEGRSILDDLLTSGQVAALLQMRPSTVEDYARRGVLPSIKLGRHRRYLRHDLEQAIMELAGAPATSIR